MFVVVYNNSVILGPMRWNRRRFENEILEECEVTAVLPDRNDGAPIMVSDSVKVLPVQSAEQPLFNPKIEFLHGPFWEFTDAAAISSYVVQPLPIDAVKNQLKAECAAERYRREVAGTKVTVQGTEVTADTGRGSRDIFTQKYLLAADGEVVKWKFPEGWLDLTKSEFGVIVSAVAAHVQAQFDWESTRVTEIEACSTLEQLDAVVIRDTSADPNRVPGAV